MKCNNCNSEWKTDASRSATICPSCKESIAEKTDSVDWQTFDSERLKFGGYDWRVLDVQGGKALLLSDKILEERRYRKGCVVETWEQCAMRQYLNGEFFNKFSQADRDRIAETKINTPKNLWFGTSGGNDTTDKIFLLSIEEIDQYFGNSGDYLNRKRKSCKGGKFYESNDGYYLSNAYDKDRVATHNGKASWWWLRSPGELRYSAAIVCIGGDVCILGAGVNLDDYVLVLGRHVNLEGGGDAGGVRPALWLNLNM